MKTGFLATGNFNRAVLPSTMVPCGVQFVSSLIRVDMNRHRQARCQRKPNEHRAISRQRWTLTHKKCRADTPHFGNNAQ